MPSPFLTQRTLWNKHYCYQTAIRLRRRAFDSVKNHKRQRRKRQVLNRQTRKVANAKGLNRNTNLA